MLLRSTLRQTSHDELGSDPRVANRLIGSVEIHLIIMTFFRDDLLTSDLP